MNGPNNFDETHKEYSLAPADDLVRFWGQRSRSQQACGVVKTPTVTLGHLVDLLAWFTVV